MGVKCRATGVAKKNAYQTVRLRIQFVIWTNTWRWRIIRTRRRDRTRRKICKQKIYWTVCKKKFYQRSNTFNNLDEYKWQFRQIQMTSWTTTWWWGLERDISAQIYFTIRANTFTYLDKITNLQFGHIHLDIYMMIRWWRVRGRDVSRRYYIGPFARMNFTVRANLFSN